MIAMTGVVSRIITTAVPDKTMQPNNAAKEKMKRDVESGEGSCSVGRFVVDPRRSLADSVIRCLTYCRIWNVPRLVDQCSGPTQSTGLIARKHEVLHGGMMLPQG